MGIFELFKKIFSAGYRFRAVRWAVYNKIEFGIRGQAAKVEVDEDGVKVITKMDIFGVDF